MLPPSPSRDKAIIAAQTSIRELRSSPPTTIGELHAVEGWVASGYFFAWRALPIKWKAQSRHPVHVEWQKFFSRSALNTRTRKRNGGATHPVNAMLNYAYSLLEAHVRIGVIADGYDPARGLMHSSIDPDSHSLVFDLMEPFRPVVDRAVIKLVSEEAFSGADFYFAAERSCRLSPELARRVVHGVNLELRETV